MTGLPQLGRRGEGWVALQALLLAAAAATGFLGPRWPGAARLWLEITSAPFWLLGVWLFAAGGARLGWQLTPFPKPVTGGTLRDDGAYGLVRHPIYGGVLTLAFAFALVASPLVLAVWVVLAAFFDTKRRREEAWLLEEFAGYADYRRRVRRRFIPFVW
jgi:protein-S-isoprenylcysteine O-methyltransferase Ste14